jgi:HPt (histidine-containing phosphotransfer) domain-containing protein
MMSSNDDETSMRRALEAGCDQYLTKPFTREAVLSLLHELDSGSRAAGQARAPLPPRPPAAEQPPLQADPLVRVDADLRAQVPAFLASRVEMLDAMVAALAAGDRAELHRIAHRAAGGLALFGFEWAACQSRRISAQAASAGPGGLQQEIDRLRRHLATVVVE